MQVVVTIQNCNSKFVANTYFLRVHHNYVAHKGQEFWALYTFLLLFMMFAKGPNFFISFFPLLLLFLLIRGEEFIILHLVVFFFFLVNLVATCKVVGRSKLLFFVHVCVIAYKTHVRNESNVPTFFLCFGWEGEKKGEGLWEPLSLFCFLICFMFFQKGLFCFLFVSWCKSNALEVKT